jgi:dipeptidyl aminopeptidase/acylaminoacyl peptidase
LRINGWRTPGEIRVWDMERDSISRTFEPTYAGLDPDRFVRPESLRIRARDRLQVQGLLYLPDEESQSGDGPPPVLFLVHGGPTAQSMATFDPVVQYHVDRGIAVFEPNVRGSSGLGRTYMTLDDQEKRRDSVRDLIDMAAYLREDGRVDMDRAAVAGGSYGGYMVNAVLALYPETFAAGVSLFGVADWVTALQIASPALKASDRIEYGDIREQKWIDYYTENSPIRMADQIQVPVLYSHGVMDPRIDVYETEVMVKTLRANGIEAPYIRIEDEGHGWRKLSNRLFYYRAQAEFLEKVFAEEE